MEKVLLKNLNVGSFFQFEDGGSVYVKTDIQRGISRLRYGCVCVSRTPSCGMMVFCEDKEYIYPYNPAEKKLSDCIQGELIAECMKRGFRVISKKEYKWLMKLEKIIDEMPSESEEE